MIGPDELRSVFVWPVSSKLSEFSHPFQKFKVGNGRTVRICEMKRTAIQSVFVNMMAVRDLYKWGTLVIN